MSYWKPDVLMDNERAFRKPTRDRLDQLRREHHVRWLFVDKRFGVDLAALERLADLRLDRSNYAVFRLGCHRARRPRQRLTRRAGRARARSASAAPREVPSPISSTLASR